MEVVAARAAPWQKFLAAERIASTVYYPVPIHMQPIYEHLGYRTGDLPESERAASEALSLPMYPELRKDQIARVVEAIAEFVKC